MRQHKLKLPVNLRNHGAWISLSSASQRTITNSGRCSMNATSLSMTWNACSIMSPWMALHWIPTGITRTYMKPSMNAITISIGLCIRYLQTPLTRQLTPTPLGHHARGGRRRNRYPPPHRSLCRWETRFAHTSIPGTRVPYLHRFHRLHPSLVSEPAASKAYDPNEDHCLLAYLDAPPTFQQWITPHQTCPITAMSVNMARKNRTRHILAIPDSGASHILVRQSDAHILDDVQYSLPDQPPYAVLKAANNANLQSIGRGTLRMAGLQPTSYIFRDSELAANLLGLAPFCDLGCTAVFKQHTFQLFQQRGRGPIMTGTRQANQSLWRVEIPQAVMSDHIPPQFPTNQQGIYIEANFVSHQDTSAYVRFIQPCGIRLPGPIHVFERRGQGLHQRAQPIPPPDCQNGPKTHAKHTGHGTGPLRQNSC